MKSNLNRTKLVVVVGIFSAIAFILMFFSIPLPFLPPFLKIDLSNVPVMICGFAFGPVSGIISAFIKAFLQFVMGFSTTGGVGEFADFLCAAAFVGMASMFYKRNRTFKNACIGCLLGIGILIIVSSLVNYFLLIPAYSAIMPLEQIFELCKKSNPYIEGMKGYILLGVVPFNLIKGLAISLITVLVYKKISKIIK